MYWKAWKVSWRCCTGIGSSPAKRRRPAQAYSEASTALPRTGHPHMAVSTVWAGAGRRPWQHSTPERTSPMLTTPLSTTALSESVRHLPCQVEGPLHFRRQGGTLFRRRSADGCRFEGPPGNWAFHRDTAKKYMEAVRPPMKRDRVGSTRSHLLSSRAIRVTFSLAIDTST